jgi:hypothetical protein
VNHQEEDLDMLSMRKTSIIFALTILAVAGVAGADGNASCYNQAIGPVLEPDVAGGATVCVLPSGLTADLRVHGLVPGNAYTTWWTYFDDPSLCVGGGPGVCGPDDFYGDDPLAVLGRMDSAVVPANGRVQFKGSVNGMVPSPGSQIWIFVWAHGPADGADGRQLARQLLTPEDPTLGPPHLGIEGGPLGYPAAINVFVVD